MNGKDQKLTKLFSTSNNKWEETMRTKKTHTAKRDKTSENHRVNSFPPDGRKLY